MQRGPGRVQGTTRHHGHDARHMLRVRSSRVHLARVLATGEVVRAWQASSVLELH